FSCKTWQQCRRCLFTVQIINGFLQLCCPLRIVHCCRIAVVKLYFHSCPHCCSHLFDDFEETFFSQFFRIIRLGTDCSFQFSSFSNNVVLCSCIKSSDRN